MGAILETGLQTTSVKIRVPCHLQRHFQLKAPQVIFTGQGQKLISLLSRDISQGQVLTTGVNIARRLVRTGEEGGNRGNLQSHTWWTVLIGTLGISGLVLMISHCQPFSVLQEVVVGEPGWGEPVGSIRHCAQNRFCVLESLSPFLSALPLLVSVSISLEKKN